MNSKKYFTVGPSALYPQVDKWTSEFYCSGMISESHRSKSFQYSYQFMDEQLRILMKIPNSHSIFIASSGSEIFEKILQNCVKSSSFHFINGDFSNKFYEFALKIGINAKSYHLINDFEKIPLIDDDVECICMTHNETSNGDIIPMDYIYSVKDRHPSKFLAIDIVSSAPLVHIDFTKIDMAFFSGQKLFGIPPGLGIWIINSDLASQLSEKMYFQNRAAQNILSEYINSYRKFQTPSTPNTLGVYLLGKVAENMNKIGLNTLFSDLLYKKEIFQKAIKSSIYLELANKSKLNSDTIIVANCIKQQSEIISLLEANHIVASTGYKSKAESQLRFSNFPANTIEDVEYLAKILTK